MSKLILLVRGCALAWRNCSLILRNIRKADIFTVHRCAYLRQVTIGLLTGTKPGLGDRVGVHLSYLTWMDSIYSDVLMVDVNATIS